MKEKCYTNIDRLKFYEKIIANARNTKAMMTNVRLLCYKTRAGSR